MVLGGPPHTVLDQGQRAGPPGRAPPPAFPLLNHPVSLGVCHPGWEAEQKRTDWQTDSEDRKPGGAAPNVRSLDLQTVKDPLQSDSRSQLSGYRPHGREVTDLKEVRDPL